MITEFSFLSPLYLEALQDYAIVATQPRRSLSRLKGSFFNGEESTGLKSSFQRDWIVFLKATTILCLSNDGFEKSK